MSPGLSCLHNVETKQGEDLEDELVDIVAVHGLNEDPIDAWTDPSTGLNWLRDLVPKYIRSARVLTYGYDASAASFFGPGAAVTVQRVAECFVQELYANRNLDGMRRRPIIFVCHGLGGVIVKKSLVYSSTRTAAKAEHLWDQYVSTFAILFFGTPHGYTAKSTWTELESLLYVQREVSEYEIQNSRAKSTMPLTINRLQQKSNSSRADDEFQFLKAVNNEFMPLMRQFRMFFFWEEIETDLSDGTGFFVDSSSAVIDLDNTEKAGIYATHLGMVKFSSSSSPSFRTVIEALSRYCNEASRVISHRWRDAMDSLNRLRAGEAYELGGFGFQIQPERLLQDPETKVRRSNLNYFYPPQEASPDFTGRSDMLERVYQSFFPRGNPVSSNGRKSFVVYGMGGSGKTQFCSKFALDNKERYTAVFTVHAASLETIKDSFCKIGKIGGLEATESAGKHFLSQLTEQWLLVVDNADNPALDLPSIFPIGSFPHILVTTRNPTFRQQGTLGSLELKGLREDEALRLLLTRADIPRPWDVSTEEEGNRIARTLGYLALALIHAGTCIFQRICNLKDYLHLYSTSRSMLHTRHQSQASSDDESNMIHVVYSSFDISLNFLLKKQTARSQDASELLNLVSFYHFESIPVEVFTRVVTNRIQATRDELSSSLVLKVKKAVMSRLEPPRILPSFLKQDSRHLDKYRVTWAISELQSLSLISYDSGGGGFSLHPLVHAWARDRLSESERKLWAEIAFQTLMESVTLPSDGSQNDGDYHRDILPHLDSCLKEHGSTLPMVADGLQTSLIQIKKLLQPTLFLLIRNQVLNSAKCGYIYAERGKFKLALGYLTAVKDTLIKVLGYQDEKTMSAMLGAAGVCWGLGKLEEAVKLQQGVVNTKSKIYGARDKRTLQAMDQLGKSYWLNGQYREALALQELTAKETETTLGRDHHQTLAALDNYGVTLGSWYRFEESRKVHLQVLRIREKTLGESNLDTLTTKNNLAMALMDLGRLNEAKSIMSYVHEQRQLQLGKEHPWTLWALCYLAKIHIEMGLLQEAEAMLTWGCAAGERSLSKDHLGVIMGRGELARVYTRQGRLDESLKLSEELIPLVETSRGISHPDCVFGLFKLAQLYEARKEPSLGIETCRLALERADMRIGRDHPLSVKVEALMQKLLNVSLSEPDILTRASDIEHNRDSTHDVRRGSTW